MKDERQGGREEKILKIRIAKPFTSASSHLSARGSDE
jgi:hypothetical protein